MLISITEKFNNRSEQGEWGLGGMIKLKDRTIDINHTEG